MNPGFNLGPFRIHYYGLILGLAVIGAYIFLRFRARRAKFNLEIIDLAFVLAVPLAIIGARLWFVLFNWEVYRAQPGGIITIWEGGLAIHGALLGGLVGAAIAILYAQRKKIKVRLSHFLDLLAPALLGAQALGRLGNFVNQEAFGSPSELPWAISIDPARRPPGLKEFETFHPTFAYEALWNLVGVFVLLWVEKRWRRKGRRADGSLFALYLVWYSAGRFFIEALRTDSLYLGQIRIAQLVSVTLIIGGLIFLWYRKGQWKRLTKTAK